MKVAIIGAGQVAQAHGPLIPGQDGATLVAIVDIDARQGKALGEKLGVTAVYQDAAAMLDEQRPDVVHVLVPPQAQPEQCVLAMEHGCHVLVEKPMAVSVSDAEEMVDTARRKGVKLCVNQNGVLEETVQRALALVSAGAIGEVVSVEAHEVFNTKRSPAFVAEGAELSHWSYRMNGGPLQDMLPHPAFLVLEFLGEIEELMCVGLNRGVLPSPWQDELRVLLRAGRVTGFISVSVNERPDIESLTIRGSRGLVHADSFSNIVTLRTQSGLPRSIGRGLSGFQLAAQNLRGSLANAFRVAAGRLDRSGGIETAISRFYDSIRSGDEPPVSLAQSVRVVDLIQRLWPAPAAGEQGIRDS